MSKRTPIVNISGDYEESILQLARELGTDRIRRRIFNEIYGRIKRPRSLKQIMAAAEIPVSKRQQAQNAINHLCMKHLITQIENDGSVKDGSQYLYEKDSTVRAHKTRIIHYANNRGAAKRVPTKRRPAVHGIASFKSIGRRDLKKRKRLTVLYLTANPDESTRIRVDAEFRRVQEKVRGTKFRDNIRLEHRPAADLNSLIEGLNDHRPQIVHFSGHSNESKIATDSGSVSRAAAKLVSYDLLARALTATDTPPEIIVLNSCRSSAAKKHLLPSARIIIAMRKSISDIAAATFAPIFYAAIASGQSVKAAFEQGKVAVEAASIDEGDTPELFHTAESNPAKIVLT